jgi:hypothetical protein
MKYKRQSWTVLVIMTGDIRSAHRILAEKSFVTRSLVLARRKYAFNIKIYGRGIGCEHEKLRIVSKGRLWY